MKKTPLMRWIDDELAADPQLAQAVDDLVGEMKLEQQIVALREKRGLTQQGLAKLLGTSQPYVAKIESGRVKNLGIRTLVKCAHALGASIAIRMEPVSRRLTRSAASARRRSVVGRARIPESDGLAQGAVAVRASHGRSLATGRPRPRRRG